MRIFQKDWLESLDAQFQKISIPTPRKLIGIPRGRGSQKPKFLKETKLEILGGGGGGGQAKKPSRGMDIFWNHTFSQSNS